jgi:hypothetical protein
MIVIAVASLIIFVLLTFGCVNHRYKITEIETPAKKESLHLSLFTMGGLVPIFNNLDKDTVCPNSKIKSINMHDSIVNTTICTVSLFLLCPHTVGIVCE